MSSVFATLFDTYPDAIAIIDAESGEILDANPALADLLECSKRELIGRHYTQCFPPDAKNDHHNPPPQLFQAKGVGGPIETEVLTSKARAIPVEIRTRVVKPARGKRLVEILMHNISNRQQIEEARSASEERYHSLVDNIGIGVTLISPQMEILAMNRQMRTWYPNVELARQPVCYQSLASPPCNEPCAKCPACSALQDGEVHESVVEMPTENGVRTRRIIASPVRNRAGAIVAVTEMVEDITERKRAEDERARLFDQLRIGRERTQRLAQQVVAASEDERKRLSRELHDEASQMLTVLSIQLDLLRQELPMENDTVQEHLEEMIELTTRMGTQMVGVVRSLRPPALDTLGLNAALEELCGEFSQRSGLAIAYHGTEIPKLRDMATTHLYRVAQEALTNVAKHARARQTEVRLAVDGDVLHLSVGDDGAGFDAAPSRWGLGLVGIRERIDQLGGQLEIRAQTGKGTHLEVTIPCKEPT
ncbi:MAG TPA: PAS domain S-box protein [Verrucomicrobiae bacterium]|nr:PAS domain S-box protein [Verrucomicrobiae bacterium]